MCVFIVPGTLHSWSLILYGTTDVSIVLPTQRVLIAPTETVAETETVAQTETVRRSKQLPTTKPGN